MNTHWALGYKLRHMRRCRRRHDGRGMSRDSALRSSGWGLALTRHWTEDKLQHWLTYVGHYQHSSCPAMRPANRIQVSAEHFNQLWFRSFVFLLQAIADLQCFL